jgi:Domain of unknown function (DUF4145)
MSAFTFAEPPRIARCLHCGTGRPQVAPKVQPQLHGIRLWAVYTATCCGGLLFAVGPEGLNAINGPIETIYPDARSAAVEIPDPARRYLQQAFETLHAPDAAAVMAGSAVDAMLKHFDLIEGTVHKRIDQAVSQHILTPEMGKWAQQVRFVSNQPRHADTENPHVPPHQAQQSVDFAEALGHYLFVLPSRVTRGIEAGAKADESSDQANNSATQSITSSRRNPMVLT